jgi:ribosomal protection tetracycline resistance protein
MKVVPDREEDWKHLEGACQELALEDPLLDVEFIPELKEISLHLMGMIQTEILQEELLERFQLPVTFRDPTVIYKETVVQPGLGFVSYTMPKPCWAILQFYIRPGKRGSGVQYHSEVPVRKIQERYQHQVEQALPQALSQGRLGWQVTDVHITLTGGNHHLIHTHPLDFIVATPMGIQDGLRRGGSVLLEPILEARFWMPAEYLGRVISDVQMMRGEVTDTEADEETVTLTALIPAASSMDYPTVFASVTGGKGGMSTALHSYRECPQELGATARRRGVDPLDTAKYILAARSALEGNIYD